MQKTAAQHIHTISKSVRNDGREYEAHVFGAPRADGTWVGWIEFVSRPAGTVVLQTGQETTQPHRQALEYWAGGLEPVYLQGALSRAR